MPDHEDRPRKRSDPPGAARVWTITTIATTFAILAVVLAVVVAMLAFALHAGPPDESPGGVEVRTFEDDRGTWEFRYLPEYGYLNGSGTFRPDPERGQHETLHGFGELSRAGGDLHGHWSVWTDHPGGPMQSRWYWHGDEITEAEWIGRNQAQ